MSHEKPEKISLMFAYLELNLEGNKITLAAKTAHSHSIV